MPAAVLPLLSPKRLDSEDGGAAWYPYYAGFSFRFATAMLRDRKLRAGAVVLDPWMGSGTTTCAAALLGFRSHGIDLNPFAVVLACARMVSSSDRTELLRLAQHVASVAAHEEIHATGPDPLGAWLLNPAARRARSIERALASHFDIPEVWTTLPSAAAFLLLCLVRSVQDCVRSAATSNPTWKKSAGGVKHGSAARISRGFLEWSQHLTDRLIFRTPPGKFKISVGDSRHIPIAARSVDVVLTSPPYCTRIDYAVKTRLELALLGHQAETFGALRRGLMGTTMIRAELERAVPEHWPSELSRVLQRVRDHGSHRSEGYYFRNLLQYFDDADAAIAEIARVLKTTGVAFVVLQSSYYKEIPIDLPGLFAALAREHGLRTDVVMSVPVKRVMTSVNSRSRQYRDRRNYVESVLRLRSR